MRQRTNFWRLGPSLSPSGPMGLFCRFPRFKNRYHVSNRPKPIRHASGHCRGDAKRLVDAAGSRRAESRLVHRRTATTLPVCGLTMRALLETDAPDSPAAMWRFVASYGIKQASRSERKGDGVAPLFVLTSCLFGLFFGQQSQKEVSLVRSGLSFQERFVTSDVVVGYELPHCTPSRLAPAATKLPSRTDSPVVKSAHFRDFISMCGSSCKTTKRHQAGMGGLSVRRCNR
jgi:hypothetical protein